MVIKNQHRLKIQLITGGFNLYLQYNKQLNITQLDIDIKGCLIGYKQTD